MKRIATLALAVLLLLAACSQTSAEPSPSPSADPDAPVLTSKSITLTVWADPGGGVEWVTQAAAAFNAQYPNIRIQCESADPATVVSRVMGGSTPDLFFAPHTALQSLAEGLFVLPSRDQTKAKEAVASVCARSATLDGVLYGYAISAETYALFYNKALASNPPATWEELASAEGGFVLPANNGFYTYPFLWVGRGRNIGIDNLTSLAAVDGMAVFQKLRKSLDVPSETLTADYAEAQFAAGQASYCVAGLWSVSRFSGVNYGVAPLPALSEGDEPSYAVANVRLALVSAYAVQPDEASAFAAFLQTDEMQALQHKLTGALPATGLSVGGDYGAGFAEQLAYAAPALPESDPFWAALSASSARIWDGADVKTELAACAASLTAPQPEEPQDS